MLPNISPKHAATGDRVVPDDRTVWAGTVVTRADGQSGAGTLTSSGVAAPREARATAPRDSVSLALESQGRGAGSTSRLRGGTGRVPGAVEPVTNPACGHNLVPRTSAAVGLFDVPTMRPQFISQPQTGRRAAPAPVGGQASKSEEVRCHPRRSAPRTVGLSAFVAASSTGLRIVGPLVAAARHSAGLPPAPVNHVGSRTADDRASPMGDETDSARRGGVLKAQVSELKPSRRTDRSGLQPSPTGQRKNPFSLATSNQLEQLHRSIPCTDHRRADRDLVP